LSRRRFAIYYAPEEGSAFDRFGCEWLGRKPRDAIPHALPALGWTEAFHAQVIDAPRLYGLHATLKPPMALAAGVARDELLAALGDFGANRPPIVAEPLALAEIDGFLALRPGGPMPALDELAAACVERFDRFRAPPSDAERTKRLAHPLTPRQRELLDRWGYPYVIEEFRFHITLTDRLGAAEQDIVRAVLLPRLRVAVSQPFRIDSICLFEQAGPGQWFVETERVALGGRRVI
jgi:putative phosphonate metabolism protein